MEIQSYFKEWSQVIPLQKTESIMRELVSLNKPLCPGNTEIFKAFLKCRYEDLRLVIIGQDPYCTLKEGRLTATGLAFANNADTPEENYSPSLQVIRDSVIDFTIPHKTVIFDPTLEEWAKQGVLLINSALTCEIGKPGIHSFIWRPFMREFLHNLSTEKPGTIYLLLGDNARSLNPYITRKGNQVLADKHPSWYARNQRAMPHSVWKEIDRLLIAKNGYSINWYKELN